MLKADGSLRCWITGSFHFYREGELQPPDGIYTQLSTGESHSCAVREDGGVACWGQEYYGAATPPAGRFKQVSAGGSHSCAIRESGEIACWGWNRDGQASPPAGLFSQVSAGQDHTCAVRVDGGISCWGKNYEGQAVAPSAYYTQVSVGDLHTCAVRTDNSVVCWGLHFHAYDQGQADPPDGQFTQVSAGGDHSCAVSVTSEVVCWGRNDEGQTTAPVGRFRQVSAGGRHTCAITNGGALKCWGDAGSGNTDAPSGHFAQVSAGGSHTCAVSSAGTVQCWGSRTYAPSGRFRQVSAGGRHTCAVTTGGAVQCWGANYYGESDAPAGRFSQVSAGGSHTCGITSDGVVCWGRDRYGQSQSWSAQFTHVSAGGSRTCAVYAGWGVYCWGVDTRFLPGTDFSAGDSGDSQSVEQSNPEELTARIVVRPLADGRIEFALQATDERRILPDTRLFPRNATVDSWLTASTISYHGQPLGQIAARRLADGRTEFSFVTPEGKRLLPSARRLPANPSEGWKRSSEIDIPLPGCRLSDPVEDGLTFPTRNVTIDESGAVYRVTGVPLQWSYTPEQVVGNNVKLPGKWIRTGSDVRYLVCGDATPTDQERDRALELSIQQIQNQQAFAALPEGVPTSTNLVNVKARYHPSDDKVEMFIVDVNAGDELKVDSRYVFKSTLEDGAWHSLDQCVEVSNWQCVTPLVRLANDQYEFGVRSADTQVEPLYPSSRGFSVSEFEKGAFLDLAGLDAFHETSSVAVPGLGADQCKTLAAAKANDFDDWVTIAGGNHVMAQGGVYYICRGEVDGYSSEEAAFTAAVRHWLVDLSGLRKSSTGLGVETEYYAYEEEAKEEFDTGIWPGLFGEFLKWTPVVEAVVSGASEGGVPGAVAGALSRVVADKVQEAILEPINEANWGSNTDRYLDAVPAYYQLGARVGLIGELLDQWEEIEGDVEGGDTLSYDDAETVYAAWRELRAVALPAAMAVTSDGFIQDRTDLDAIADKLASFLSGLQNILDRWNQLEVAKEKVLGNPEYFSTFTKRVEDQYSTAIDLWGDVYGR